MKVLMVCLGNICRSPLAHGILERKVKEAGLNWTVDSAGTAAYHVGELPDPRSIEVAAKHGLDITYQRARQFVEEDFSRFDKIIVMDKQNYTNVTALATSAEDIKKVSLLLNYQPSMNGMEVPDPYYGGDEGFQQVYEMVETACEHFIKNYEHQ